MASSERLTMIGIIMMASMMAPLRALVPLPTPKMSLM